MNITKRIAAAVTAMTLCVSLTACGGNGGSAGDSASTEKVIAAIEKLNAAQSFSVSMQQKVDMTLKDESDTENTGYTVDMNLNMFQNPLKAQGQIKMNLPDQVDQEIQQMDLYMQELDGKSTVYINAGGEWVKSSLDNEKAKLYNVQDALQVYLNNTSSFKEAGSELINDADATKFTGVIQQGEGIEKVVQDSGLIEIVNQFDIGEDEIKTLLSKIKDMPVTIWINADGYPVQYEVDLTNTLNSIVQSGLKSIGASKLGISMDVSGARIRMSYSNFDNVKDFEIPAETKNAVDMAA